MNGLTGLQLRAGRALLKWRPEQLAKKSRVSVALIKRAELLDGPVNMSQDEEAALTRVFAAVGITLINDPNTGIGVTYSKPKMIGVIG